MFDGLKRRIQDFRIDWAFPQFERLSQAAHEAEAQRRFDASGLRLEIKELKLQTSEAARLKFSARTEPLERERNAFAPRLKQLREQVAILTRDYKAEIDALYLEKNAFIESNRSLQLSMQELQAERARAQLELNDAFEHLKHVQESISGWHEKSKRSQLLLGNKGQKLPKHAMFGQSHGDLYGLKSDADRAGSAIGSCKSTIAGIEAKKGRVWGELQRGQANVTTTISRIEAVKAARTKKFEFLAQGLRPPSLQAEIAQLEQVDQNLRARLDEIELERAAFFQAMEAELGIPDKECEIRALAHDKAQFLGSFDSEHARIARKAEHREIWISARG